MNDPELVDSQADAVASPIFRRSSMFMDTIVTIDIVAPRSEDAAAEAVARAFNWFQSVEDSCSRFDARSEIVRLSSSVGRPVHVSPLVTEVLAFALEVAETTEGAFDPTVGAAMQAAGFDRNFRTGEVVRTDAIVAGTTYRDVIVDRERDTVTLQRPLALDLGAVAKGFAIDLAGHELDAFENYSINAGGDLLLRGVNAQRQPWRVGIRDPRTIGELVDVLALIDRAVCTSGDYERPRPIGEGHHILVPTTGRSAVGATSVTVIAETAMVADALATAAFVLGSERGLALLEEQGVEGIFVLPSGVSVATPGIEGLRA